MTDIRDILRAGLRQADEATLQTLLTAARQSEPDGGEWTDALEVIMEEKCEERQLEQAREELRRHAHQKRIGYTRIGAREQENADDYWYQWAVFPATDTRTNWELLDDLGWFPYSGGPGAPFAHRAHVCRKGSRILVTQSGGLDI
jgi:hypothetical protein